ncbi:MAG: phosphate ABC transporter substrate-binding protein PstS [Acidimicrobiia bacterium]|nr:phosphate ABC transporter substrate-binding protein PstS [Acidimicrobiia bacterium]
MRRSLGLVAVLAALSMVAAACGSDNNKKSSSSGTTVPTACDPGTVSGAGSTFVANIAQQWIKDFQSKCSGATVTYQGVGSGAGIQQFTAGTVDFGASDVVMSAAEEQGAVAKGGQVSTIPWSGGGIAVEYNLSGVSNLKLSPETLAGIFAGKIKSWDDQAIKNDNSGVSLPSSGIQVIHRSDGSGTTAAFTGYLAAVAPMVWTAGAAKDVPWPTGQGAKGSDGVTAAVKQASGAIGYAEVSYAKGSGLPMASIKNAAGSFVQPDAKNVTAALSEAQIPADLKIKPNYMPTGADAYPISTFTFVLAYTKQKDPAKGKVLKDFLTYAVGQGQSTADMLYYAPLPTDLQTKDKAAVDAIS